MGDTGFHGFNDYLGTSSPIWKLSNSSDELVLSATGNDEGRNLRLKLKARQVTQIKRLTGATTVLFLDVEILGRHVRLHLVGKKITTSEWAGVAAALRDSESVAQNSMQALAFAEEIVSEVNSIVVVLDRSGTIRRFNRKAEEYTGCKEENVIGENAQMLFMSPEEGRNSRDNISRFFEQGRPFDVQRMIETVNGSRPFLFRNRFIRPAESGGAEFIVCSGVELVPAKCDGVVASVGGRYPALDEMHGLEMMKKIMDWAALVDGVRALLASVEGGGEVKALAHARSLAASAIRDAYQLYDEIDARILQGEQSK
ncbi:PAS domain S-box protein [Burkholderia sp. Ac-20353]|uniref:PAS domain S-box protein n=1 Tax=Burkholderia sp. Ac-20353 TaxID=2703894 RepID=UPI00197B7E33|nr:PAS domain S-box protein [Burkholderia sp. Ac-20353]MBN3786116.1 PAS domain S-box protein [Burkholderia sp. Ac-20353]